jgi:hypothetical protein
VTKEKKNAHTITTASALSIEKIRGGPNYGDVEQYDLTRMQPNGVEIYRRSYEITGNIVYLLPRNIDTAQLRLYLLRANEECEVEYQYLNERLKAACCYFGDTIQH